MGSLITFGLIIVYAGVELEWISPELLSAKACPIVCVVGILPALLIVNKSYRRNFNKALKG